MRWTGASLAVPPGAPADEYKALAWALSSAHTVGGTPTSTVTLVHHTGGSWQARMQQAHPGMVRVVARIPTKQLTTPPRCPVASCGVPSRAVVAGWPVVFVVVANPQGQTLYTPFLSDDWCGELRAAIGAEVGMSAVSLAPPVETIPVVDTWTGAAMRRKVRRMRLDTHATYGAPPPTGLAVTPKSVAPPSSVAGQLSPGTWA